MKVLVGVDGSSNSFAAVAFISRLLSPERDHLVLIFATPMLSLEDEVDPEIEQRARSVLSRTVLHAALDRLPEEWRNRAEQKEAAGSPSHALLDAIREHEADLVAVGFRGTSGVWEEFILGSVSRAVVQSATVPVLVVKHQQPDTTANQAAAGKPVTHLRVLAAYDGMPAAKTIAGVLSKLTWPESAEGWVLSVVRPMFPFDLPDWVKNQPRDPDVAAMAAAWEQEHQQNLESRRHDLQRFRDDLPRIFANHDVVVVEGRPAEQIVAQLRARGIDLAVVGSRGRGRIERLLLGSTAAQVLASSPCSVLITR
jgi:nucleotide-binding universal stress UspA family protein